MEGPILFFEAFSQFLHALFAYLEEGIKLILTSLGWGFCPLEDFLAVAFWGLASGSKLTIVIVYWGLHHHRQHGMYLTEDNFQYYSSM